MSHTLEVRHLSYRTGPDGKERLVVVGPDDPFTVCAVVCTRCNDFDIEFAAYYGSDVDAAKARMAAKITAKDCDAAVVRRVMES